MPNTRELFIAALLLLVVSGCALTNQPTHVPFEETLELEGTPFFPQDKYQCGPASLAMLLGASGTKVTPGELVSRIYLPGRRGSLQLELIAASRQYHRIPYIINNNISALIAELTLGRPVLVLQNLGLDILPAYHYAVVIGMLPPDQIVLRSGINRRLVMDVDHFLTTWNRTDSWAMIVLKPGELPAHPHPFNYLEAVSGFEKHGNLNRANEAYRAGLATWPEDPNAMIALANNYLLQSHYREADLLYRKLLKIYPEHIPAANNLADSLLQQECYPQALALINKTVEHARRINSPLTGAALKTQQEIVELSGQAGGDADMRSCPERE